MDEPVAFGIPNVDEGRVNAGQHVLHHPEVNVAHLVTAGGHDQFLNAIFAKNGSNAVLFGDDNLFGHADSSGNSRAIATCGLLHRREDAGGDRRRG